ncbi:MAG: prephenate dehydrogenase/arogenate dehydrogenase family protein [Candidatus Promineofilum sp.]|uniref:prephenate dehydrogenase n=1 Tax=Promineifilum sp. TaxID=2664178 RepID=UPI002411E924|nr:prephenate dehydrogenase/arogenate dehydrogenase family protein [Promineifilum sp.]
MTPKDDAVRNSLIDLRVGIVGLGLMGGSLALALRGRVARLTAIERQADVRQLALRGGIVSDATESLTPTPPSVDLLVLATPVRAIVDTCHSLPDLYPDGCAVMDLGSTKREIVAAMDALPPRFAAIGGHPMCGKETAGLASATADLYRDQTFLLCPSQRTTAAVETVALSLIDAIGAHPLRIAAADHDTAVAAVSHLPALLSAALMRVAADERLWPLGASGFRDTSRLAGSDARMMLDILLTNRKAVLEALRDYETELAAVRLALEDGDEAALAEWLAAAQVNYAAYRRFKSAERLATAPPHFAENKPGKIA